ncbi:hypothetical protein ACOMHN_011648 [Nucella lapillus]
MLGYLPTFVLEVVLFVFVWSMHWPGSAISNGKYWHITVHVIFFILFIISAGLCCFRGVNRNYLTPD